MIHLPIKGDRAARTAFSRSYSLAYAVADEAWKARPVPPPEGLPAGPHLFNAVTPNWMVGPACEIDRDLHSGAWAPAAWRRWGRRHVCVRRGAAA